MGGTPRAFGEGRIVEVRYRLDEEKLRVWFENWEDHDAAPSPAFGGSTFANFPE